MRYIWTMWTDPWKGPQAWDLLCYAVSVGLVRQFNDNVTIYADARGAQWIEDYGIEAEVEVMDFGIWPATYPKFAEAKLKVMARQTEPFCHIDHDVFLLKPQRTFEGPCIVTQCIETQPNHSVLYRKAFMNGQKQNVRWPEEMVLCAQENEFKAYNCGYVMATDLGAVASWCQAALFISAQFDPQNKVDNAVVEQMSLYALSRYRGLRVECLFTEDELFQLGPEIAGYVHLMGAKSRGARSYITSRLMDRAREVAPCFIEKCFSALPADRFTVELPT